MRIKGIEEIPEIERIDINDYSFEDMDMYQLKALKYDVFFTEKNSGLTSKGEVNDSMIEKALGLTGEAGEVAEIIKKSIRDKGGKLTPEDKEALKKELGDVLWYLSNLSMSIGVSLGKVAKDNIDKLESRQKRGKIHGSGDNR